MAIARKETLHLVRDPRSLLAAFALPQAARMDRSGPPPRGSLSITAALRRPCFYGPILGGWLRSGWVGAGC